MSTQGNKPDKDERQEKESGSEIDEEKKIWPRESLREEDEKASAEIERHLWPEGEPEDEEKKIWPRESLREEDEKTSAEIERELWSEDEKKGDVQKKKE
jgi:hypothetical protein